MVPKLKKSATSAISSAVIALRGTSIMVPMARWYNTSRFQECFHLVVVVLLGGEICG